MALASWFRSQRSPTSSNRHAAARKVPPRRLRLELERLEDRTAPAVLVVTSAADPPGPLVPGTLRYEVNQANQDARSGHSDTILFDRAQMGSSTVTLRQGALVLDGTGLGVLGGMEAIDGGGGVTISGNHHDRVFLVDFDVRAALTGLTIRDGASDDHGGGIFNQGTLTVSNATLSGNSAFTGGGGIFNQGTLTVSNTIISGNDTYEHGAGGIENLGSLTLTNCTVAGNTCILSGVTSSECSVGAIRNSGTLTVTNCTISGNSAKEFGCGGIGNACTATIGNTIIGNTIIAGNTALGAFGDLSGPHESDAGGYFISQGHNLIGNGDDSSGFGYFGFGFLLLGDQVGTGSSPIDPLLGPLQYNGGPTQTMALLPGSRAIDRGSNALVPAGLTTDQRGPGFNRFSGARVDIGAFEHQAPTVTVHGPRTDPEGTAVTLTGSVTGGDTLAAPYNFTWHVTADNGQSIADQTGTVSAPFDVPSFTFTPADEGAYTVTLTVTDQFNLTGTQSAALTATNVTPTATITGLSQPNSLFILAGDALTFSGAFSDPGTLDGHTVTWNFGDGNSTTSSFGPGGSASFIANFAFAAPGTYLVTLTVMDDDGGVGTAQMTVIVQTPADAASSLLSDVQSLAQLNAGQQNSLVRTLNAVTASLTRGNTTAATNQLGAFENKVKALFGAGLLTQAQEDTLLGSADAIDQAIG
jgi:hypothetical protein